jgi:hypothetical protein
MRGLPMKVNSALLDKAIYDKINLLSFHTVVNKAFLEGLPFGTDALSPTDKIDLSKYSLRALEGLGGTSLLTNAIKNTKDDIRKNSLLTRIENICTENATKCSKRITKDMEDKGETGTRTFEELIGDAKLTKEEYSEFIKSQGDLDLDRIAEIVKNKAIEVIKSEREAYERNEEMNEDLKVAVDSMKNFKGQTVESYLGVAFKNDVKEHRSLFSRLQEVAYEALLYSGEVDELPMGVLNKVTFENSLEIFNFEDSLDQCLESLQVVSHDPANTSDPVIANKLLDTALNVSTIEYTLLETLNTMNLYQPPLRAIESFVNGKANNKDAANKKILVTSIDSYVGGFVSKAKRMNVEELDSAIESVTSVKDKTSKLALESAIMDSAMTVTDKALTALNDVKKAKQNPTSTDHIGYFEKYLMESDLSQFNKAATILKSKADVHEIQFKIDSDKPRGKYLVDLNGLRGDGSIAATACFEVQYLSPTNPSATDYIKDNYSKSKLPALNKKASVYNRSSGLKELI